MYVFKVWNCDRSKKKSCTASSLEELKVKGMVIHRVSEEYVPTYILLVSVKYEQISIKIGRHVQQ